MSQSSFWKGAILSKSKTVGTVRFVPISAMSARDWRWLDFDNIRTVAQNRIARMAMAGRLTGFFQVLLVDKAAKNEYFWPATQAMEAEFAQTDDPTFFLHEAEALSDSQALEALEELRLGMAGMTLPLAGAIVRLLIALAEEEAQQELDRISENYFDEMADEDIELMLAIVMMWVLELEEALAVLEEFPDSDGASDLNDWIADRVAEVNAARAALQPIAAGRGIS